MSDIDKVADITFSQPISTADEVAQSILDLCGNNQNEAVMSWLSGVTTTASYLMPWLGKLLMPILERKGANVKAKLKRQR